MLNEKIISAIIEQVLLEVCLNYRNSIPRKAFINAPLTVILPIWMVVSGVFTAEAISQLLGGFASFSTMYFTVYRKMGKLNDGDLMPGHHV